MRWSALGTFVAALSAAAVADAGIITLNADARGWYYQSGYSNGRYAGNNTFTGFNPYAADVNSWFGFDLSGLHGSVSAAALVMNVDGYTSTDATETIVFRHVETPAGLLGTVDSTLYFTDLMSGTVLATHTFSGGDAGTMRTMPLNAAGIADVGAAIGGFWEVGAHLSTLSRTGGYESLFWGAYGDPSTTQLRLVTVPEPSTALGLVLGLVTLAWTRRRRHLPTA